MKAFKTHVLPCGFHQVTDSWLVLRNLGLASPKVSPRLNRKESVKASSWSIRKILLEIKDFDYP